MIKIFQLITSINLGGAEIVAINLLDNDSRDIDIKLVEVHSSSGQYASEKKKELIKRKVCFKTLGNKYRRLSLCIAPMKLFYLILLEKPDIIHSHTDLPDFVLGVTLRLLRLLRIKPPKIVRTIHNNKFWHTHFKIGKMVEASYHEDYIVGVSDSSLNAYRKLRRDFRLTASSNQQVIHNGCEIPKKLPLGINLDSKKINIAYCGRFETQKGVDILVERIHEINIKYHDRIDFHLIGSGSLLNLINKTASLYKNIHVHLPINNMSKKIHEFDFLIMPSRFEGLVLISMEASLSKVPVIASRADGLVETLPKNWALNFELMDSKCLMDIIEKIIFNDFDLEELKKEAFTFVSENYSYSNMLESYSILYKSICKLSSSGIK